MSAVSDLIERAVSDLEQGWYEAAVDALGRAIRASEAARWDAVEQRLGRVVAEMAGIVADVDARLKALEERRPLHAHNAAKRHKATRLDREIELVLDAACPRHLTAKEVWHALNAGGAFPTMPALRTVGDHLRDIRKKRQHTVDVTDGTSQPIDRRILQTSTGEL